MAGPITLQAFDTLIDETRSEGLRRHAGEPRASRSRHDGPLPVLRLGGDGRDEADPAARSRRGIAVPASMFLHALGVTAVGVLPLLLSESLPGAGQGVRAFFVEPIAVPAPPPPPPPAPARSVAATRVAQPVVQSASFTAPIEVPTEIVPEEGLALGVEGGVAGGVEGGMPGGVVGGVVGGLPDAPPPPPTAPLRVGGDIRAPRKVVDVPAVYPPLALKARLEGVVVVEATIDPKGRVQHAVVLRSLPLLDEAALEAVRQWVYTPTLLNGVPMPVIMTVTVNFRLLADVR